MDIGTGHDGKPMRGQWWGCLRSWRSPIVQDRAEQMGRVLDSWGLCPSSHLIREHVLEFATVLDKLIWMIKPFCLAGLMT